MITYDKLWETMEKRHMSSVPSDSAIMESVQVSWAFKEKYVCVHSYAGSILSDIRLQN